MKIRLSQQFLVLSQPKLSVYFKILFPLIYFKEAIAILSFMYCFWQNAPTYHLPKHKRVPFWPVCAYFGMIYHWPVNEWIFDAFSFNFPGTFWSFSRFCQTHIAFQAWYTNIFTHNKNFIYNINLSVNKYARSLTLQISQNMKMLQI